MSGRCRGVADRIAICIPVRNEEARLPAMFTALEALDDATDRQVEICLLLDTCVDGSAALCAAYRDRSRHRVTIVAGPAGGSNAGLARDRAMRIGVATLGDGNGILLTTDADSRPCPDWLTATVAALAHADVVAGQVVREGSGASDDQDRIDGYHERLFALRRRIDPVPWEAPVTQPFVSGANIALRVASYVALGGFTPLPHGEDARLIDDAQRAGLRVRRDAASMVRTSDRRTGRVEHGLAAALRHVDRFGLSAMTTAHPMDLAWQYRAHAIARQAFASGAFAMLTSAIGLDDDHLLGVARDCPNAEAFAMRVVPVPPGGMRAIPFTMAEAMLARMHDAEVARAA